LGVAKCVPFVNSSVVRPAAHPKVLAEAAKRPLTYLLPPLSISFLVDVPASAALLLCKYNKI